MFEGEGVNVDDAINAAGEHFHFGGIVNEFNVFGANAMDQFTVVVHVILRQRQSFHVLVVNNKTMIIVDRNGTIIFIDSHIHGHKGALFARSDLYNGHQA